MKELRAQLQAMQNQLASTQALLADIGQQPRPRLRQQLQQPSLVTAKEVTEFGEDLYDFVKRAAAKKWSHPRFTPSKRRFRPVAQTVQQLAPAVQQNAGRPGPDGGRSGPRKDVQRTG